MSSAKDRDGQERAAEKKYHVRLEDGVYLNRGPNTPPMEFFKSNLKYATPMTGVVARILATAHRASGGKAEAVLASECRDVASQEQRPTGNGNVNIDLYAAAPPLAKP